MAIGHPRLATPTASLASKITQSATGLAKDLFSTDGCAAHESTNDLARLRTAHKLSSVSPNTTASPRLPKQHLSSRHHEISAFSHASKTARDFGPEPEYQNELSGFLFDDCSLGEASASSSRSGSTLNLTIEDRDPGMRESGNTLHRSDSFEPELSRSRQKSPSKFDHDLENVTHEQSFVAYEAETGRAQAYPLLDLQHSGILRGGWLDDQATEPMLDNHRTLSTADLEEAVTAKQAYDTSMSQRKQKALDRLQLLFSHMPSISHDQSMATKQAASLDTAYSQLCLGEDASEWAAFEALSLHGSSQQRSDPLEFQSHQSEQTMAAEGLSHTSLHTNLSRGSLMQHVDQLKDTASERPGSKKKEATPMAKFHCPWVECHQVKVIHQDFECDRR